MERHAAGSGMSASLQHEVRVYQLAKLDDAWAKPVIAMLLPMVSAALPAKSLSWRRRNALKRHLENVENMGDAELASFSDMFLKHKAIGQLVPARARSLQPVKGKMKQVTATVYRCGQDALFDWTLELKGLEVCPLPSRSARSAILRLQTEYIHAVLQDGATLSVPLATSASSASSSADRNICFDH